MNRRISIHSNKYLEINNMSKYKNFMVLILILYTHNALSCPNAFPDLINDICWSCAFPILIGGTTLKEGIFDEQNPNSLEIDIPDNDMICSCGEFPDTEIGLWFTFWHPYRVIELTSKPYCMPFLFGTNMESRNELKKNEIGNTKPSDINSSYSWGGRYGNNRNHKAFYNAHIYSFPLHIMMDLLLAPECDPSGYVSLDLLYFTEVDMMWNDDIASLIFSPEASFFSNPVLQVACTADCAAANVGFGFSSMQWCSGCVGSTYPMTGNVGANYSSPSITSLLVHRILLKQHRFGMEWKTIGDKAKCGGYVSPSLPKSQYKISMIYPVPESSTEKKSYGDFLRTGNCCHPLGRNTFLWGEERNIPTDGDYYLYLVWRKVDCCIR